MENASRQSEMQTLFDQYIKENPQIGEALEVFQIGQEQYFCALAQLNSTVIVSSTTTNEGINNA